MSVDLSESERVVMTDMMNRSPNSAAKKYHMSRKEADAVQKYLTLILHCDRLHTAGKPYDVWEKRALEMFRHLPRRLREYLWKGTQG